MQTINLHFIFIYIQKAFNKKPTSSYDKIIQQTRRRRVLS